MADTPHDQERDLTFKELCQLTTRPTQLVNSIPRTGNMRAPLMLKGLSFLILIAGFWQALNGRHAAPFLLGLILGCIIAYICWFALNAYMHAICKLFGGQGNYAGTLRADAYTSLIWLMGSTPFIGPLCDIYAIYVYCRALKKVHSFTSKRLAACIATAIAPFFLITFGLAVTGTLEFR